MVPDLEPFLDRVRALFPDTRGHGLSQKFERVEDYTYARKAEDMLLWLDHLGIAARGVGRRLDGRARCRCGWPRTRPARVRAVVSISGPPYAPLERRPRVVGRAPAARGGRALRRVLRRQRAAADGRGRARAPQARPERYAEMTARLREHSLASLLALLDETYSRADWLADCARIRCPSW